MTPELSRWAAEAVNSQLMMNEGAEAKARFARAVTPHDTVEQLPREIRELGERAIASGPAERGPHHTATEKAEALQR